MSNDSKYESTVNGLVHADQIDYFEAEFGLVPFSDQLELPLHTAVARRAFTHSTATGTALTTMIPIVT